MNRIGRAAMVLAAMAGAELVLAAGRGEPGARHG